MIQPPCSRTREGSAAKGERDDTVVLLVIRQCGNKTLFTELSEDVLDVFEDMPNADAAYIGHELIEPIGIEQLDVFLVCPFLDDVVGLRAAERLVRLVSFDNGVVRFFDGRSNLLTWRNVTGASFVTHDLSIFCQARVFHGLTSYSSFNRKIEP